MPNQSISGEPESLIIKGYSWGGNEVNPESFESIAKEAFDSFTGVTRYWIKYVTSGSDRGHLFNPNLPSYTPESLKRIQGELGKGRYAYKKVTKEAFDHYMQFLKHPHLERHYRYASRSI